MSTKVNQTVENEQTQIEIGKQKTMEQQVQVVQTGKRTVKTSLMGKDEVFKLLSLAEALQLPILLVGEPGVGKTNIVMDYSKAMFDMNNPEHKAHFDNEGVFMIETDEGTRSSQIKGNPDMEALLDNKFVLNSPITKADTVIINEVDKASSALRNSLLGIMNERVLFDGKDKTPCRWKLFVATCNEIPKDEIASPFWDRFSLKMKVDRLSVGDLIKYYQKGDKNFTKDVKINIPTRAEIDQVEVATDKLEKFLNVAYKKCSDRTLTFAPLMAKAISLVYNCSVDKAIIKACELLVDRDTANKLSKELLSQEKRSIMDKVDLIQAMTNEQQIETAIADIEKMVGNFVSTGKMNQADLNEIEKMIASAMAEHPCFKIEIEVD